MLTAGFESGSDMTKQIEEQMKANMPAQTETGDMSVFDLLKMLPEEQRAAMLQGMDEQMADLPDTILEQAAVAYVQSAYEELGLDMDDYERSLSGNFQSCPFFKFGDEYNIVRKQN